MISTVDTLCQAKQTSKPCELLEHPKSLNYYNVAGNGKRDSLKNIEDWTISSQASQEWEEGSTTNAWRPNGNLPVAGKATRVQGDSLTGVHDIVWSMPKGLEIGFKRPYDNKATLFTTKIGKVQATATKHEFQTQALAAGTDDYAAEGDVTAAEALTPTVRLYNTCQIQKKVFNISGTEEKVKKGGAMQSEIDRQTALKMKEHAKNIETMALSGIRADADPRRSRGALNWCTTNLGKADDAVLNADGTVTPGTARPLTEALVLTQLQNAFTQGGSPDTIYGAPYQKKQIAGWVNTGNTRRNVDAKTLTNSVDVYDGPFGLIAVKPHRNMPTSVVFLCDHQYWKMATLRATQREQLAKSGDATPFHIITEHCVEACSEAASARITDLTTAD